MSDRLPSLPLFVDDYEGATAHLTLEEDGAYMRLLRLCWRTPRCSIPDEPEWIMRRLRIDQATYDRVVTPLISEFFKRARGRIFQKRLLQEFVYAVDRQKKRSEAGKKGGSAKAQKTNDKGSSKRTALPEQTQGVAVAPSPAQPKVERGEEAKASPPARGRSKSSRSVGVDVPLPDDWKPNLGPAAQAIVDRWPPGLLERDELAFRSHATANGRLAKDWDAAFRTWITKTDQRRIDNDRSSANHPGSTPYRSAEPRPDGVGAAFHRRIAAERSRDDPGDVDQGAGIAGELPLAPARIVHRG